MTAIERTVKARTMLKYTSVLSLVCFPLLLACPDPPPQIADAGDARSDNQGKLPNRGGPEGDPDSMDLSPGGTMLLDISQVVPQSSQEELKASDQELVTLNGTLTGSCDGGSLRIDVIEVGVEHTDQGPMIGPVTALSPKSTGEYSLVTLAGKNVQVAALCDIDNDGKIVQDTDKLAPGVALGVVDEDKDNVDLVFPGEGDTPVEIGSPNGEVRPPGDSTASLPSTEAGERDRVGPPSADGVPPPPEDEAAAPTEDATEPTTPSAE